MSLTNNNMPAQEEEELKLPFAEEIALIKQYVNKDSICLDIGANIGSFTVFLASIARHVYAFEPEPNNFKQLEENTTYFGSPINSSTSHLNNIKIVNYAVSDKLGINTLHMCPTDNGMHRLYNSKWCDGGEQIEVKTTTIDFFTNNNKISFIKIDVEGWEYHVIKGATNTIKRDHPVIMMEWHPPSLEEAGTNPREFYDFMIKELGYQKPDHMLLPYAKSMSYEELHNYTVNTPAINILWT